MDKRIRLALTAAAMVPLTALAACGSGGSTSGSGSGSSTKAAPPASSSGKSISETGSTLLFPLFGSWQADYSTANPSITITSGGTGSGTGIADASQGLVNIGASDAYLSTADMSQYPGLENIPLAVAGINVNYNVSGVKKPLNLNGTVLAGIYSGKITTWNNSAITKLNPGVSLPAEKIVTVHRADSSGSTFLFTSYLNAQDPSGWSTSNVGTTITWPSAPGALAETGSGGVLSACGTTKGCIAYLGVSYATKATAANLGQASLANKAGKFVQSTPAAIKAALSSFPSAPASGSESLINTSAAAGYPIINYEYAIVKKKQSSAAEAKVISAFLSWILSTGQGSKYMTAVNFQPLPSSTLATAKTLVSGISG